MSETPPPSLLARLPRPNATARHALFLLGVAILAGLAWLAIAMTLRAGRVETETAQLLANAPSPIAAEAEARAIAAAFARPRAAAALADLATHLPPDTPLAQAGRTREGTLAIAIDAADPDALRTALAADPYFEGFREKRQEERADGRIRVTLVEQGE